MTRDEFLSALRIDLRLHGVPFDPVDLRAWLDACWPLIAEEPDVLRWSEAYQEQLAEVPGSTRQTG